MVYHEAQPKPTVVRSHFGSSRFGSRPLSLSAITTWAASILWQFAGLLDVRSWQGLWQVGNMEEHAAQQMARSMVGYASGYNVRVPALVVKTGTIHKARLEVFGGIMRIRMEQEHGQVLCEMWTGFRVDVQVRQWKRQR